MSTEPTVATGTRGPYRNGVRRRQEIVRAAALVFGQQGFHSGSLRAIAEKVGTTPATLLGYFSNKEGLLVAVLQYWRRETSFSEEGEGLDYLRAYVPLMRYHVEHRGLIELFLTMSTEATQPGHPARPFIVERQDQTRRALVAQLGRAVELGEIPYMPPESLDAEGRLIMAALDGIELQWLIEPDLDLERTVRYFIDSLIARLTRRSADAVRAETNQWLADHDESCSRPWSRALAE